MQQQRRLRMVRCAVVAFLSLVGAPARPAAAATPAEVDQAIKKAVKFLYAQEKKDNWEQSPKPDPKGGPASVTGKQWGGLTSMAVYGLLSAGENAQDPRLDKAIVWLLNNEIVGVYAVGMRSQVWPLLPENSQYRGRIKAAVNRDRDLLLHSIHVPGAKYLPKPPANNSSRRKEPEIFVDPRIGFHAYFYDQSKKTVQQDWYDRSVSQYGVLGMWACQQAGAEVSDNYWKLVDAAWKNAQQPDGGWNYQDNQDVRATMTAAGVATLFITQDYLLGDPGPPRGNLSNPALEKGLEWMDRNIAGAVKGGDQYYYLMYGIERIGVASGKKYFGTFDWYSVGADELIKRQEKEGSWGGKSIPDTVFAMMFLIRGRAPVVMNKLEYYSTKEDTGYRVRKGSEEKGSWNQRPRDLANFTHWLSRQSERYFNWQVVNLKVPAEKLLDCPILYISGSDPLGLPAEEEANLKRFVEAGGMVLANTDGGRDREKFTKSFIALGQKLFPSYEFRDLEANHPIYTREQYNLNKSDKKPKVLGLSNGARELMLLIPEADASRWWHARDPRNRTEVYQLGANIHLYASERSNTRYKGDSHFVADKGLAPVNSMKLARLQYAGNWNPEPGGWRRLGTMLKNDQRVGLETVEVKLGEGQLKLSGVKVAHLTGTSKLQLADPQRQEIKQFVEGGGTLIIDATGGSRDFAESADAEMGVIFGKAAADQLLDKLPLDHPLYQMKGAKINEVAYREFAKPTFSGRKPTIKAITVAGRPAVFISPCDLSVGLVGQPIDGVVGYEPASAAALMRNMVLFGEFGKVPSSQPTAKPAAAMDDTGLGAPALANKNAK